MNNNVFIGKVVSFDNQADQVTGQGWGWRYKVRILDHYSEQDGIEDRDVVYAMVLLPATAGSGAREMMQTPRISQGDTVIGRFLADDNMAPIIDGVLPRTKSDEIGDGKFDQTKGFTNGSTEGILGGQEFNENDNVSTPGLKTCKGVQKGGGKGRNVPQVSLQNLGIDPNLPPQVNAIKKPRVVEEIEELKEIENIADLNFEIT
tara:strand:+ start:458 stop:1069 length:612 start_codon:yes stop_codon:yes gene_type:complete